MSLEFSYTDDKGVRVIASGEVTGEDLYRTNEKIYRTPPSIDTLSYQLWDLTEARVTGLTRDVMDALAAQDRKAASQHPQMVIAIAVKADHAFGFTRMWEANVDDANIETHVCRSVDEAQEWLDEKLGSEAATS